MACAVCASEIISVLRNVRAKKVFESIVNEQWEGEKMLRQINYTILIKSNDNKTVSMRFSFGNICWNNKIRHTLTRLTLCSLLNRAHIKLNSNVCNPCVCVVHVNNLFFDLHQSHFINIRSLCNVWTIFILFTHQGSSGKLANIVNMAYVQCYAGIIFDLWKAYR